MSKELDHAAFAGLRPNLSLVLLEVWIGRREACLQLLDESLGNGWK